jgi:hypothetical protein
MSNATDQGISQRDDTAKPFNIKPQAVRSELWLDLEDTIITPVINGWHNFEVINLDKILLVMESFAPHSVNVFSFAIWNQHQLALFNTNARPCIERALGISFNIVPTVDDHIIPWCCKELGISPSVVDFQEMSAFWGKQGTFRLAMRQHAKQLREYHPCQNLHLLLLDDVVFNERLKWPDLQTVVEQRNIHQL